ncbi:hypothetical protein BGX23_004592, partial [Mortierella sp. AD031]
SLVRTSFTSNHALVLLHCLNYRGPIYTTPELYNLIDRIWLLADMYGLFWILQDDRGYKRIYENLCHRSGHEESCG